MKFAINSGLLDANPASTIGEVFENQNAAHGLHPRSVCLS